MNLAVFRRLGRDQGAAGRFGTVVDAVHFAIWPGGLVQIDAELAERRCGEQGDETGQQFDQRLHGPLSPNTRRLMRLFVEPDNPAEPTPLTGAA